MRIQDVSQPRSADRVIGRDDPELDPEKSSGAASFKLGAYGFQLASERAGKGGADLISLLVNAPGDAAVTPVEFASLFIQLFVAGNETTRTLLTGTLVAFTENPDAYRALEREPALLETAIEEMLRWTTPVRYFRRTATRDVEFQGHKIRAGLKVVLHYTSADLTSACSATRSASTFAATRTRTSPSARASTSVWGQSSRGRGHSVLGGVLRALPRLRAGGARAAHAIP